MRTLLSRAGFNKRTGTPSPEAMHALMLWIWLKKDSIGMFAREGLQGARSKDARYDAIEREDLNWRNLHGRAAAKTVRTFKAPGKKAFAVDDTTAQRFGKKMPGKYSCRSFLTSPGCAGGVESGHREVPANPFFREEKRVCRIPPAHPIHRIIYVQALISSHFDPTSGRPMIGQQVLTLGLSCEESFVPLDSELYMSGTKAQTLHKPFQDGRSVAAKRYWTAQQ